MARIPDDVVERLKREVSLVRLVEASGVVLTKHGENLLGKCPFHSDKTPSLVVTPSKNLWHCLGACQTGGTVIDWVKMREKCSTRAALEMLMKDAPALVAPLDSAPAPTTRAKLSEIVRPEESDSVVLGRVADFYHTTLKERPEALSYLESRGLRNEELISTFKLGFANRTLAYRLPVRQVKAGEAIRDQLQRLGVMRDTGHELFNGSVVVPIFDGAGQVVEMYGRKITPNLRTGTAHHLYLPGPHRGILNAQAFTTGGEIILCEAIFDALTFWAAGLTNVTTSYGVAGFTPELREAFSAHGKKRVLIAYDRDDAGDKAAEKLAPELAAMGHEVFRVLFPRGMDANEYAQKVQPAKKSLETALRAAHWMAGSRPVLVPRDVVEAHAEATVAAESTNSKVEKPAERATVAFSHAAESEPHPSLAAALVDEAAREEEPTRPDAPAGPEVSAEVSEEQVVIKLGDRTWRMRGLERNLSYDHLKVSVLVARGDAFHVDQVELYSARHRAAFLKAAAGELQVEERILKSDLGKVFWKLERLQDAQIKRTLEVKPGAPTMSESERVEALALLQDPELVSRIASDFTRCGVVGEDTNKVVGYLAAVSRKLEEPLAVMIQSSSASGKSALMDAVLGFVPDEEKVSYSAMTGQSLFYMGATDLQHKVLGIAEEEGASNASYSLKILQSSGELTIAAPGKDPATGKLITQEYRVTGPVMVMMTTTSIEIDPELLNRCLVLTVDEGAAQTRAIQDQQRASRTLAGRRVKHERGRVMALHQNAQRLLRPLTVVNELAPSLVFASHAARMRRDNKKYLTLIDTIAFLHQHQRPVKTDPGSGLKYIEVSEGDIELANALCARVLASTVDELAPQTRRLHGLVDAMVTERAKREGVEPCDVRFTRRELRDFTRWGDTQLKVHVKRLEDLEYLHLHGGGERRLKTYSLCVSAENCTYDTNWSGQKADWSGSGRGLVEGAGRPDLSSNSGEKLELVGATVHAYKGSQKFEPSYTESSYASTSHAPGRVRAAR